jgi:hypothetical protein
MATPTPISTPTPTATPTQPTPTPSPDVFQVEGAIACEGIKDCYAYTETNGRQISETLEQQLQAQGYTLQPLDLNDDTGMKVYQLFQKGQPEIICILFGRLKAHIVYGCLSL